MRPPNRRTTSTARRTSITSRTTVWTFSGDADLRQQGAGGRFEDDEHSQHDFKAEPQPVRDRVQSRVDLVHQANSVCSAPF